MKINIDSIKGEKILLIGDVILENKKTGICNRISPEAPVPVVNINKQILSLFEIDDLFNTIIEKKYCELITVIGDDSNGKKLEELVNKKKELNKYILFDKDKKTFEIIKVYSNQQILTIENSNQKVISKNIENNLIKLLKNRILNIDSIITFEYDYGIITRNILKNLKRIVKNHDLEFIRYRYSYSILNQEDPKIN
jgi:bifunctional ADP-heptose synthase (sugar kinase/adenylyltransferase)